MMRPVILGLCFCAGTTAFCQSTVPAPTTPERLGADSNCDRSFARARFQQASAGMAYQ
jgi:hypothetical protein